MGRQPLLPVHEADHPRESDVPRLQLRSHAASVRTVSGAPNLTESWHGFSAEIAGIIGPKSLQIMAIRVG